VERGGRRRALVTLCVTEITSWGVLYYAFPVLAGHIAADTGLSMPALTGAFSASLLVAALAGIPVGRWLDRHGPRGIMTVGSLLAVPAVLGIATAGSLTWFIAAWLVAGLAMGGTLYPPAFAALTRWYGPDRVRALTVLTLAAGLASTVFAPVTAGLLTLLDWRGTYLVLGGVLAIVTIPGHWLGLRQPWPPPQQTETKPQHLTEPSRVARSREFVLLAVALSLTTLASFAAVINLVPLLIERGLGTGTAAIALGLGGAGQVAGRLGYPALTRLTSVRTRTALILLAIAATTALLGVLTPVGALIAVAVLGGMARGIFTLLQATAITDRWGPRHYGQLNGLLSAPLTITMALAPFAGAAVAALAGGYATAFLILGGLTLAAAALSLTTIPGR
jgi:MFS family permease